MVSAFSVPKSKRQQKLSTVPGPGQYNPQNSPKIVKKTDPLYSFGKDGRKDHKSLVPGPGTYEPKEHIVSQKNPSFSMLSRRDILEQKNPTGPGQYSPTFGYGKQKSPSYSLMGKYTDKETYVPGPGQYEIHSLITKKEKGHDFGKDSRDKYELNRVPGPGSYEFENAVFKYGSKMEPSYGFGSRLEMKSAMMNPGPGTYEPKKQMYSHIGGIVSRDLRDNMPVSKTPGPGNYEPRYDQKTKQPSWSLSKSARDYHTDSINLGPGQYEFDQGYKSVINSSPAYNFAGKSQKLKYDISLVPGPGAYERPLIKSRKSIRIGERIKDLEMSKVPGPGSYESNKYDNESWMKGRGRYSLGKDSKLKEENNRIPGPGSYENKVTDLKDPSGKVTFGRDQRLKHESIKTPGPGHYELKPHFADVPKYLLPLK